MLRAINDHVGKLLILLALSLIVVGYGAEGQADEVVRIGIMNDQSSNFADASGKGSVIMANMAVEDFGRTVLGKRIEIISADHQNKADVGANIAREWYERKDVSAIIDVPNTAIALAVQNLARERNRISIITSAFAPQLTGSACSPTGFHWMSNTYAQSTGLVNAIARQGGDTFFFITADYVGGHDLEKIATAALLKAGGRVVGSVKHPLGATDYASYLLQAQASKAKVIFLATVALDFSTAVKQAGEFGIAGKGQQIAGAIVFLTDVHALGLKAVQGLEFVTPFYWDINDDTRTFSRRFMKLNQTGLPPTTPQAGVYSAVRHYLRAISAAGTIEAKAVAAKMRELKIDDFASRGAWIRADGRVMRNLYWVRVKAPSDSKYPFDYYKLLGTVPPEEAFQSLEEGGCSLVKK